MGNPIYSSHFFLKAYRVTATAKTQIKRLVVMNGQVLRYTYTYPPSATSNIQVIV
jgi:hypothetical protein